MSAAVMKPTASFLSGLAICAGLATSFPAFTNDESEQTAMQAKGTFDVTMTPQQADNPDAQAANVNRLSMHKQYQGDLAGSGQGEMLAFGDGTQSGAYVALEKVSGTLQGREGSFALVHRAALRNRVPEGWSVTVVPDSGTGELEGLEGEMIISNADGKHFYELSYTLP